MYADGNRTKCDCEQSFIKDNNQQCMCNRGYYYTPGTNGLPGNCQKCNDTSILVTPGLTQECNRCKANQYSNNDCIDCFCAPGFTKNKDGTCVCPGGFRYVRGSKGLPGQCKTCVGNTYMPEQGLKTQCTSCGVYAKSNFNYPTCFSDNGSNFQLGVCKGACTNTVYQVSASCRGSLGCTWPEGIFGFCRCNTEKGFEEDEKGNCRCIKGCKLDLETETCISPNKASPAISWFMFVISVIVIAVTICAVKVIKRRT